MDIWKDLIQEPLINVLIVISDYLGDNFGLAVITLTIIINLVLLPLTLNQIRSSKAMQDLQPKLSELQKKYAKDRQRLAKEQMALYKTSGVKPAGCALTFVIQMPVWIALYQAILLSLAVAPEGLLNLSKYLYSWDITFGALPLSRSFLSMDLSEPNFVLAILVGAAMWVQQKMSSNPNPGDAKQASQSQMMLWMMPMMFAVISLSVPSGLSLYWAANSIVRIVLQYRISGWGGLKRVKASGNKPGDKYLKFDNPGEKTTTDNVGADIVISDTEVTGRPVKPKKSRYLPGKERQQKNRGK